MNRKSFIRRVEVQIGIILGVVMFSVLGVFLGIRKGQEKRQEAVVVTKVVDDTSEILNQKALEQAQAEAQSKEGAVAHVRPSESIVGATVGTPLAQETSAPSTGVAVGVAELPMTPLAGMPTPAESTPGEQVAGGVPSSQEPAISHPITHTVKANDTLSALARKYYGDDSKWTIIYGANQLSNQNNLAVGQKLTIPDLKGIAVSTPGVQATKVEKQVLKVSTAKPRKSSSGRAYRVQQGDTLYELARTYYGDESQWKRIYNANQDVFSQREALEPGDVLIIP
ncbi:MAG: LysM peptidoglycan-binding domain-containing protein [Candidatus Brocadiales bacterium]